MNSSFAAQLSEIAANSTNELDLKAQKTAHSKSLIFEKKVALSQDFDTIYQICFEGFEDLCSIDNRFRKFRRSLFSEQSKTEERDQMTEEQNSMLDTVIESCLDLLGCRLLLNPAVKVAEWLVRRFRVHEYNTSFLLLTFLPYYGTRIFRNLMSILPSLPPKFKFLNPYIRPLTSPPRQTIAYAATNNDGLFKSLNEHAVHVCRVGCQHPALLSFWASITAEAVAGRLDLARSGRKEIRQQRQEDVLLKLLPLLKDGLALRRSPEMVVACYTIAMILASKSQLADNVLDSIMEAVAQALHDQTMAPGLICLSALTQQKSTRALPHNVVTKLTEIKNLELRLIDLQAECPTQDFALALVQNAASSSGDQAAAAKLGLVERILFSELLDPPRKTDAICSLLQVLSSGPQRKVSLSAEDSVVDLLRRLTDSEGFSSSISDAVRNAKLDPAMVETRLQSTIMKPEILLEEDVEMNDDSQDAVEDDYSLTHALERIQEYTVDERSFLSRSPSDLFKLLLEAFEIAALTEKGAQSFSKLPLWESSTARKGPLFASFCIRVFCGPYSVQVRFAALSILGTWLSENSDLDSQAILPYVLLQLTDPALRIRTIAAEVVLKMLHIFASSLSEDENAERWNLSGLCDSGNDHPISLPVREVSKIIQIAVLPALEECALDRERLRVALQHAMKHDTSTTPRDAKAPLSPGLKKHLRKGLFQLLLRPIIYTPLYAVKLGLLTLLENIDRVGGIRKQDELMPLLLHWASLSYKEAEKAISSEFRDIELVSSKLCDIISPSGGGAVQTLHCLCSSTKAERPDLISSVARRIEQLWPRLKVEQQIGGAESLLVSSFHNEYKTSDYSQIGKRVLRSVDMSTDLLDHLLNVAFSSIQARSEDSPASKRRRNNENGAFTVGDSNSETDFGEICKATFVLELVDGSSPEHRPRLLHPLFRVLTALHQFKLRDQSELSYLLSLTLGSLLCIVRQAELLPSKLNWSMVRLDVIIDCMRSTRSSQVQNSALLLVAALASVAPERVLDSIMPVFTFMGSTVLGKGDEYSNFVVDHTMEKVIPRLVESLNGRNQDLIAKTSDLVSSFVVAYEHIPSHRRLALFERLISSLGKDTFLWVVLLKLTQRYEEDARLAPFSTSLTNLFEADIKLKAYTNLVMVVQDALNFETCEELATDGPQKADDASQPINPLPLLLNLDHMLTNSNIRSQIARLDQSEGMMTESLLTFWEDLLDRLIRMVQTPNLPHQVALAANKVLSSALRVLPTAQFIKIAEHFVQAGPEVVRRKILRLFESRIPEKGGRNGELQSSAVSFLQTLYRLLEDYEDGVSKHGAIVCVDRICMAYGRKDIPVVLEAAKVMCHDSCLYSADTSVATLALLSLSSLTELIKEAVVPVVPYILPRVLKLLQASLDEGAECWELYDAGFTFISALFAHVPFIMSEDYLASIIVLLAESANSELPGESDQILQQTAQLIGRTVELTKLIAPLRRQWSNVVENDVPAVLQALSLFSIAVRSSSKSLVVENAGSIMAFLLQALDLRRIQLTNRAEDSYKESEIWEVEQRVNTVAIEIIYKLNDSTFRPIFLRLVDWATKCIDVETPSTLPKAKVLRQTTLFNFLTHFFSVLKSIVTSYTSHVVVPALAVLEETSKTIPSPSDVADLKSKSRPRRKTNPRVPADDQDNLALYLSALRTLQASLRHDRDSHFSNPSLFTPLSSTLTSHLHTVAGHPSYSAHISPLLIPTIVALATAVVDTPDHLKSLNSQICNLRRSEHTAVRRASIHLQLALIGVLDVGTKGSQAQNHQKAQSETTNAEDFPDEDGDDEASSAFAEEWCTTVLSVGEGMVYVNDLLQDNDPGIRLAAEKLVRRVRDLLGDEEIF